MRGFWLCLCAAMTPIAIAAPPAAPAGSREIEFLRAARNGDLRNVFQLGLFGGIATLPRTFTLRLMTVSRVVFDTGENPDSSIDLGSIFLGRMTEQQNGWIDTDTKRPMPHGPSSIEHIGPLMLEHYEADRYFSTASIFVTDHNDYLWFVGPSTVLAKEVALVFAAKNGPNHDFFASDAAAAPKFCFGSLIIAHPSIDRDGRNLLLWEASDDARPGFAALGFSVGDKFRTDTYSNKGENERAAFERFLRQATPEGIRVPVEREGKKLVVSIPTATMVRELPKCAPAAERP